MLPARADDEFGIMHLRCVQQSVELFFAAALVRACSVNDLSASAIVKGDAESEPPIMCSQCFGRCHLSYETVRCAPAPADESHPYPVTVQRRHLTRQALGENPHEARDLLGGAPPVLCGKRVDGELFDAQLNGVIQAFSEDLRARVVPLGGGKSSRLRPAPVAVNDDGNIIGGAGFAVGLRHSQGETAGDMRRTALRSRLAFLHVRMTRRAGATIGRSSL